MKRMMSTTEYENTILNPEFMENFKTVEDFMKESNIGGCTQKGEDLLVPSDTEFDRNLIVRVYEIKLWDPKEQEVVTEEFAFLIDSDEGYWMGIPYNKRLN